MSLVRRWFPSFDGATHRFAIFVRGAEAALVADPVNFCGWGRLRARFAWSVAEAGWCSGNRKAGAAPRLAGETRGRGVRQGFGEPAGAVAIESSGEPQTTSTASAAELHGSVPAGTPPAAEYCGSRERHGQCSQTASPRIPPETRIIATPARPPPSPSAMLCNRLRNHRLIVRWPRRHAATKPQVMAMPMIIRATGGIDLPVSAPMEAIGALPVVITASVAGGFPA